MLLCGFCLVKLHVACCSELDDFVLNIDIRVIQMPGDGPLRFSIGCFANIINYFSPFVVHAWR